MIELGWITGPELRAIRKRKGLNQTQLAQAAGCGRHAVSYWENKPGEFRSGWALDRMGMVLGFKFCRINLHQKRARDHGLLELTDPQQAAINREAERRIAAMKERIAKAAGKRRVRCSAKTRKGHPCKLTSEAGKARCKYHGGMSTGPKTEAGKARIAQAQRDRWAKWRAASTEAAL